KLNIDDNKQKNDLLNYKGEYYNDDNETKYYEGGAHFKYRDLCNRLEAVIRTLSPSRRSKFIFEEQKPHKIQHESLSTIKKKSTEFNTLNFDENVNKKVKELLSSHNTLSMTNHTKNKMTGFVIKPKN